MPSTWAGRAGSVVGMGVSRISVRGVVRVRVKGANVTYGDSGSGTECHQAWTDANFCQSSRQPLRRLPSKPSTRPAPSATPPRRRSAVLDGVDIADPQVVRRAVFAVAADDGDGDLGIRLPERPVVRRVRRILRNLQQRNTAPLQQTPQLLEPQPGSKAPYRARIASSTTLCLRWASLCTCKVKWCPAQGEPTESRSQKNSGRA